jgi:hypothetical protein
MLCRPVPKHSFIRRNLRSIYHALKCDAEDSKARLSRGKCFTWGGRRGGHGSSEARSTLSLVPQLDCLKTPKSSTFALELKRIAQLPRLYIGDFVTTPEHAQSSETLHHFFWGLVDISPTIAPRPLHTHRSGVRTFGCPSCAACGGLQERHTLGPRGFGVLYRTGRRHFGVSGIASAWS